MVTPYSEILPFLTDFNHRRPYSQEKTLDEIAMADLLLRILIDRTELIKIMEAALHPTLPQDYYPKPLPY